MYDIISTRDVGRDGNNTCFLRKKETVGENMTLSDFSTMQLADELEKRLGVKTVVVPPHETQAISVDGVATVLIVYD